MDKFVTKTKRVKIDSTTSMSNSTPDITPTTTIPNSIPISSQTKSISNVGELKADPGKRLSIYKITKNPTEKYNLRKTYLLKGPCQPFLKDFPQSKKRKFKVSWYKKYGGGWLEYSVSKDAAYCLYCYLFHWENGNHGSGHESFTASSFRSWHKT